MKIVKTMCFLFCSGFVTALSAADLIELTDGAALMGEVQKETGSKIWLKTDTGVLELDMVNIKKIDLDSREKPNLALPQDLLERYESEKLSIKTVDVYHESIRRIGPRYYGPFFRFAPRYYVGESVPKQEWEILRGADGITDLEFLSLVDDTSFKKVTFDIDLKIKDDRNAQAWFTATGLTGLAAAVIATIPFQQNTDPADGSYFYTYNEGNNILFFGGVVLAITGLAGNFSAGSEAESLENMKTDRFVHFNDMKYARGKINEFNEKLKLELKLKF